MDKKAKVPLPKKHTGAGGVVQTKQPQAMTPHTQRAGGRPIAPPVYRPQPAPAVLQPKSAAGEQPRKVEASRQPVAPPAYRPQLKGPRPQPAQPGQAALQMKQRALPRPTQPPQPPATGRPAIQPKAALNQKTALGPKTVCAPARPRPAQPKAAPASPSPMARAKSPVQMTRAVAPRPSTTIQRRVYLYDPTPPNFADVGTVNNVNDLMDLLADGNLTEGQKRWRDEVYLSLGGVLKARRILENLMRAMGRELELPQGQPNSGAVAVLSKLEALAPEKPPVPVKKVEGKTKKKKFVAFDISDQTSEYGLLPAQGEIEPRKVKYSQDTAGFRYKDSFKLSGRTIHTLEEHAEALMAKPSDRSSTPPIRLVLYKKRIMTLDNRRLKAHAMAGVSIPYEKFMVGASDEEIAMNPNVDMAAPRNDLSKR